MSQVADLIYNIRNRVRNKVVIQVRGYLDSEGGPYSTSDLVEALLPEEFANKAGGAAIEARKAFFSELLYLAAHQLSEYATKGPSRQAKRYGKEVTVHPWIWQKPKPAEVPSDVWEEGLRCLQRYEIVTGFEPAAYADGDWVRWADIEELLK